jgi:hypothetical protein
MLAQTFFLEVREHLTQHTILSIFQEFSPLKMAIKQLTIYVQIADPLLCAELIKKIKNGAFADLKHDVFEILDSPANANALLENCPLVFTTPA